MVEESFKLNLNIELDESSLARLQKQIERSADQAFANAFKKAKLPTPGGGGAAGASPATARSAREAISVSGRDLGKSVQEAVSGGLRGFEAAAKRMEAAVERLSRVMERGGAATADAGPSRRQRQIEDVFQARIGRVAQLRGRQRAARGAGSPEGEREAERLEVEIAKEKKKALRTAQRRQRLQTQAARSSERSAKSEEDLAKATENLAAARQREASRAARGAGDPGTRPAPRGREQVATRQVGASNQQTGANIDATRRGGSQRTAGSVGGAGIVADAPRVRDNRVGTVQDRPQFRREAKEREQARAGAGAEYIKSAQATSERVAVSIGKLEAAIRTMPHFKGADLAKSVGLPSKEDLRTGRGAAATVKLPSGQEQVIKQAVNIFSDEMGRVSVGVGDVISKRIDRLLSSEAMGKIEKTARFRPDRAEQMLRQELSKVFEGPKLDTGKVMGGFAAAGQAELAFRPTEEQRKRIAAKPRGAEQIAETVAILHEMAQESDAFKKSGLEVVSVIGMAEDKAANLADSIEAFAKGATDSIEGLVQTRNLAGMGVGGAGTMRQARSFLMTQTQEMVGGEEPKIKGIGEEAAYAGDIFGKKAVKHLKTAVVSGDLIPELKEDQFLIDKQAARQMGMIEKKALSVKDIGEDIVPGMKLQKGQVMGKDVAGKAVEFDLKGAEAEVKSVEKVIKDGVALWKVHYEELNEMVTGGKMTTRAGGKGIVRVEEDLAGKYGLPKGTQVAMAAEGMAKRGDLRSMIEMHASNIAEATSKSGQEVADMIVDRMKHGSDYMGETIDQAIKGVAGELGVEGYTGAEVVKEGPLAKAKGGEAAVMTGELAWMRLAKEGQRGPASMRQRFLDKPAQQAMEQRAETAAQAKAMQTEMSGVLEKNYEYIQTLKSIAGASEEATAGLKEVRPEQFTGLTGGMMDPSTLKGTVLDPELGESLKLMLPKRGGGEEAMRLPSIGTGLGRRRAFETETGMMGADPITKLYDKIVQQAKQIRVATGQVDITQDAESYSEAAQLTSRAIKDQIQQIYKLGKNTEQGKAAMKEFIDSFMPLIKSLGGAADIQFAKIKPTGERDVETYKGTAEEYVQSRKTLEQKMFAVQDILAERSKRTAKVSPGSFYGRQGYTATENVPRMGAIFDPKNSEILLKSMERLGVTLQSDAEHVDKLHDRLEALKEQLVSTLAVSGVGRAAGRPSAETLRPYAQAMGGGVAEAPMGVATEFRTDITAPLAKAKERLEQLRAAGKNVDQALAAVERIAALQVDVEGLPRDAVMLSETDYENLKQSIMKRQKIGEAEATQRMERGVALRYPVTGGQSMQVVKIMKDAMGKLPEGKIGVAGPPAGEPEDIEKVIGELTEFRASLSKVIEENKGFGAEADKARSEISQLDPVIEGLRQSFLSATQNLDFDGDKIAVFGALTEEASKSLRTFTEVALKGGMSFENIMNTILTASKGQPGGGMGGIEEYSQLFSQVAKGRTGKYRQAVMMPDTPETSQFEAKAHTAAKTSVGLLTDAFNKLQMSILGGAEQTGDAMSTAVERIMLFINKSLAQKHGGGGAAGPMEFVQAFQRGPEGLKEIFSGMDEMGDDIYGELGKFNKEYRERMYNMLIAQPRETVQQLAKEAGALEGEADLTPENFIPVIKDMVDKLDLKGQFKQMWSMLEENMKKSLLAEGMSAEEVEATMNQMLKSVDKKTGKTRGLDLNRLMKNMFPEYRATRGVGVKEIKEMPAMEQARKVLSMLGVHIGESIEDSVEMFDIDVDPKDVASELTSKIHSFLQSLSEQFEISTAGEFAQRTGRTPKQAASIRGQYVKGKGDEPGQIMISQERIFEPLVKAVAHLERVASGEVPPTVDAFTNLGVALSNFAATLSHEGIHKAAEQFPEVIQRLVRRIAGSGGDLNKHATAIYEAVSKLGNIRKLRSKFEEVSKAQKAGATEFAGMPIKEAKRELASRLARVSVEELVAHLADPQRWEKAFGHLPDAVQEAARDAFQELATSAPEIVKPVQTFADEIRTSVAETMQATFRGDGAAAAREAALQRRDALEAGEPYPGREKFHQMREVLGKGEETLAYGRRTHGLAPFQKAEGRVGVGGRLEIGGEDLIGSVGKRIRHLLETALEGSAFDDPSTASNLQDQFKEAAKQYREALKGLGRDQFSGSAWKEYNKVLLEFQAAEAQSLINKARSMEEQISEMRKAGQTEMPEFRDLLERFNETVQELFRSYEKNIKLGGVGRGTASGLAVTPDQLISEPALEMGIKPTGAQYQQVMQSYQGKAGTSDFKNFSGLVAPMEQLLEAIDQGEDSTKQWTAVWDALIEKPEAFYENMTRVKEILAKWSRLKGLETDPFSEASQELKHLSDEANNAKKAMDKVGEIPRSEEAIDSLRTINKQFNQIYQRGRKGSLAESIQDQMEAARKEAQRLSRELTEAVRGGVDLPRHFEPRKMQIVDPKSGQVLQTMELHAKRFGKTVQVSMKQAGRATQEFGGHMKNALRRVVQWGFATGAVYGTIRAFRNLIDTVTTVEQKIASLKKVMDTSVVNFERMQDAGVEFAKNFGVAIDEVLDGMVVYGQQGLKMNEIMDRTRATMLAVNVTTLSSTEATEALTAAHKVFGDAVADSLGYVDAWANVAAKHAITAADLADAVKRSGAAAQVAGVGFEDFLGVVTAIGSVTRQTGKEIATSTKFMFRAMRRPKAQKELGAMGIPSMEAGGDYRAAMDILKELAGQWDELTRAQQVNTAQAMAGIRHYNSFIVLMENFDEALLASADAANSQGFAMRKNRIAMQTMNKQMQKLRESVKGVALEIGKAFLPAATMAVDVIGNIVSAVGKLPGPLLQAGTLLAGLGITVHKAFDLALDSVEALGGEDLAKAGRTGGLFGVGRGVAGGIAGIGAGASAAVEGKALGEGAGVMAGGAKKAVSAFLNLGDATLNAVASLTKGIPVLGKFTKGLRAAGTAAKAFTASTVIGAIVVGLYMLYDAYQDSTKSAKEFEREMENVIGRSEDAASKLRSQSTQADRLSLAYKKYQKALESLEDPKGLKVALDEGRYKSASLAAQKYSEMVSDISRNLAKVDPSNVQGITESGQYVTGIAENFKDLTMSALDAQNAVTAAFKVDVIKAYSKELHEPQGLLDQMATKAEKVFSAMTGGKTEVKDRSTFGKLKAVREEINKLAEEQRQEAEQGMYVGQARMNKLVEQEVKLRQEALDKAQEMRRVFEAMPVFEDMGKAMQSFTKDLYDAMEGAAEAGVFGQGVTGGAVATAYMAKQAGLGGILGPADAVSPGTIAGTMSERGIRGVGGAGAIMGAAEDEMGIVGEEVARMLMESSIEGLESADAGRVVARAQTVFAEVNEATGELLYRYWDAVEETSKTVSAESLKGMVDSVEGQQGRVAAAFIRWSEKEIQAAAEQTKKVLSLQYTGALAGIRQPGGGMPQIGPARFEEVSAEQRVLKDLPLEMQRLSDVQKELNQITKEYSEDVLNDVETAYGRQEKSGQALKVMTQDVLQLATQLQKEGFNLTVLAHYSKAQAELNMILENAADAARDAAAAEELRTKYMVETSGAAAGLPTNLNVDFGKRTGELSSLQRAMKELPGFKDFTKQISSLERSREQQMNTLIEIEKRKARFEDAVSDLATAEEELTAEQMGKYLEARERGATTGEMELLKQLETGNEMTESLLNTEIDIQKSMLEALHGLAEIEAANAEYNQKMADIETGGYTAEERERMRGEAGAALRERVGTATREKITESRGRDLMRGLRETVGQGIAQDLYNQILQIREAGGGFETYGKGVAGVPEQLREGIVNLMTAMENLQDIPAQGPAQGIFSVDTYNPATAQMERRTFGQGAGQQTQEEVRKALAKEIGELLELAFGGAAQDELRAKVAEVVAAPDTQERVAGKRMKDSMEKAAKIEQMIAQKREQVYSAYEQAMLQQIANIEKANESLKAKETGRMAIAANDLANSLETMVKDFRKAEMTTYQKIDSDLEGPFARVGQPGFRTDFEQRRREIEGTGMQDMRPRTLGEMRQQRQQLQEIDKEEERARLKQEQDIEVQALRQQQQQAESVMDTLATQLTEGTFKGDPQMENQIRRYMETLREQLARSEQAEMRGDELYFKGIPGLEDVQRFAKEMRQEAKSKAKEAQAQLYRSSIADPIVNATNQQTQRLEAAIKSQTDSMKSQEEREERGGIGGRTGEISARIRAAGEGGRMVPREALRGEGTVDLRKYYRPTGEAKEIPTVGLTNDNIQKQRESWTKAGRADAAPGALVSTEEGIPGAASEPARRANERGDTEGAAAQADAISAIAESISSLSASIENLSQAELTVPSDLSNAIGELPSQIGGQIAGQTLTVEIADAPLSVNVANISELGSAASDAATSSLGADITELGTRIRQVEGLVSTDGTLATRLDELESTLTAETEELSAADVALGERVSSLEDMTEQLDPDAFETLTTRTATLNDSIIDLEERVETNEESIVSLTTEIETFQSSVVSDVADLGERVAEVEGLVSDAVSSVENFENTLSELEESITSAVSTAESAEEIANDLQNSLNDLRNTVESQKQSLETQIRGNDTEISQINTELRTRRQLLDNLERIANNAATVAQSAMSLAQGRR